MTIQERAEKLKEIFNNPDFQAKAKDAGTAEELQAQLAEYGFEMTTEEVTEFLNELFKHKNGGEELGESDLDAVSGGFITGGAFLAWSVMYVALNVCTKLAGVW